MRSSRKNLNKSYYDNLMDEFLAVSLDPHVRIIGRKEDVLRVKDKVMAVLDAKVRRRIAKFL